MRSSHSKNVSVGALPYTLSGWKWHSSQNALNSGGGFGGGGSFQLQSKNDQRFEPAVVQPVLVSAYGHAVREKFPLVQNDQQSSALTRRALIDQHMSRNPPTQLLPGMPAAAYYTGEILAQPMRCEIMYYQRQRYIREFGFCLFSSECVAALASICKGKRVMEAGSGTGWLASQLTLQGIAISAVDWADYSLPPDDNRGYPMQTVFRLDYHGDALTLLPGNFDVVLLIWPNHNTPFGEQVARAMKPGQLLILASEAKGGRMATDAFFEVLGADFELLGKKTGLLNEHHRTFPGLYDRWQVLRKK